MERARGNLRSISEVIQVMGAMADGDLTQTVEGRYEGTFADMQRYVNTTMSRLTEIVDEVNRNAENLASASEEVSATAQALAQAASEQAAGVEETSASLEQMTASIAQNTENARVTDSMAAKAASEAADGGDTVRATVVAMKDIAKKIGIIDDIAYQTNLLALNAAIEQRVPANTAKALPWWPPKCASWQSAARLPRRKSAKWPNPAWNWPKAQAACWARWCLRSAAPPTWCRKSPRPPKSKPLVSVRSIPPWAS